MWVTHVQTVYCCALFSQVACSYLPVQKYWKHCWLTLLPNLVWWDSIAWEHLVKRPNYCVHGQGHSDGLKLCQSYIFQTTNIFAAKLGVFMYWWLLIRASSDKVCVYVLWLLIRTSSDKVYVYVLWLLIRAGSDKVGYILPVYTGWQ